MISRVLRCCFFALLFIGSSLYSTEPACAEKGPSVSQKEAQEVLDLLEDPAKRDSFVRELKNLVRAKEELRNESAVESQGGPPEEKEQESHLIENLFAGFDRLTDTLVRSVSMSVSLLGETPEAWQQAKTFFSSPQSRSGVVRLLASLVGGVLIGLLVRLPVQAFAVRLTRGGDSLPVRIGASLMRVLVSGLPYAALSGSLFIFFRLLPSFRIAQNMAMGFFMVLGGYRVVMEALRSLFFPDDRTVRILNLTDENANYLWVWSLWFIRYGAFYMLAMGFLSMTDVPGPAFSFLRGILLLAFPSMASVFFFQIGRETRLKYKPDQPDPVEEEPRSGRKIGMMIIRYWPLLAVAYAWTLYVFVLFYYKAGYWYLFGATLKTAVAVPAIFLVLRLLDWVFVRFFAIAEKTKRTYPGLEERTNRYFRMIRMGLGIAVTIVGLGIIAQAWGVPVSRFVGSEVGYMTILRTLAILVTVAAVVGVVQGTDIMARYFLEDGDGKRKRIKMTQKTKTLIPVLRTTVNIAAGFVGGIVILNRLGVSTTPILAGAGILGLAVGFGSQALVKDLINGLFILFEESIRVGDWVNLGTKSGLVEAVGLRKVRLRDFNGNVHIVPNSSIDQVTNYTKEFSRVVMDIGVAYREDVDRVMEILREIGNGLQEDPVYGKDIVEPLEIFGLDRFEDSALIIRARFATKPMRQWTVKREFYRRMKRAFDELGIEIPFPHRTLYMGEPKEGPAPPLQLRLTREETEKTGS